MSNVVTRIDAAGQHDVAGNHRIFTLDRHAGHTQLGGYPALVDRTAFGQRQLFGMLNDHKPEAGGIFQRLAHHTGMPDR